MLTLRRVPFRSRCFPTVHPSPLHLRHTRSFFGLGEVLGVITNPAETIRQLNESKELLRKAKDDLERSREAKRIPRKHTFSKLPGFHGRKAEQAILRKVLSDDPKLSVIFGATSVGKTALLREVLATDDFYVIKFDLRISGFANLRTLYVALCEQFERFFEDMHDEEMDKQKLTFKHLVLELQEKEEASSGSYEVSVADVAGLMESLQSCLLRYWEYTPPKPEKEEGKEVSVSEVEQDSQQDDDKPSPRHVEVEPEQKKNITKSPTKTTTNETSKTNDDDNDAEEKPVFKKRPVVFLMDEAHKLPALVQDQLSLKVFLDTVLVLTKQDRLCHVLLSTSDSFFHHFLRSMNVGHHAQILTIGDCTRAETQSFFRDHLVPTLVPEPLRSKLDFGTVFDAFGGKLSHVNDYVSSWVNSGGELTPYTSAIFIQAYTLLQFHLTHSKFETFSPLTTATAATVGTGNEKDEARFAPEDLVYVMKKLVQPPYSMPYFTLCRDIGTEQVDSMIKTRILELRWTKTVSPEENWVERKWSEDGIERPIVLPMTRIVRRAMEVVLKEEYDREQEREAKAS